jgi:beta-glucanase (GH16 family)
MFKSAILMALAVLASSPLALASFYPCEISGCKNAADGITAINVNGKSIEVNSKDRYTYLYDAPVYVPIDEASINISATYKGKTAKLKLLFDFNADGVFNPSNELVATVATNAAVRLNIPSHTKPGAYRARLQVDKKCAVDFVIHLADKVANVETKALHGQIFGSTATSLPSTATSQTPIKLMLQPTLEGYEISNIIVRHGFNLKGNNYVNDNMQWTDNAYPVSPEGFAVIPANDVYGDVEIYALFKEAVNSEWTKVWSEEFNNDSLDVNRWNYAQRSSATWSRYIAQSNEGQKLVNNVVDGRYKSYCFSTPNNLLQLENADMISGAINSRNKFYFTYGKVEARVRTKNHAGNFPAFWLMPQNTNLGWPKDGEIDVWESIDSENIVYGTVHTGWARESFGTPAQKSPNKGGTTNADVEQWRVYSVEWNSEAINWYLDGKLYFTYHNMHYDDGANYAPYVTWPFDNPFYIILNQSVGNGTWAAEVDRDFKYGTEFDYVRVYQKKNDATYTHSANLGDDDADFYTPGAPFHSAQ